MTFTLIVSVLLSGVSNSNAEGFNERLHGTYAVNTTITCNYPSGPTNDNTNTIHNHGLLTFYGDGFGVSNITALSVNHNPRNDILSKPPIVFSGNFTYTVESDDYFTINQNLSAPAVTISGVAQEGWIGRGGHTLVISDTELNVETLTITTPGGQITKTRTCGRTGTAIKVSKQ